MASAGDGDDISPQLGQRFVALIRDVLQVEVPTPDTDLIDAGLIDSLALVSLITEIERDFGFELPLEEFNVDSFRTVERMIGYIGKLLPASQDETDVA